MMAPRRCYHPLVAFTGLSLDRGAVDPGRRTILSGSEIPSAACADTCTAGFRSILGGQGIGPNTRVCERLVFVQPTGLGDDARTASEFTAALSVLARLSTEDDAFAKYGVSSRSAKPAEPTPVKPPSLLQPPLPRSPVRHSEFSFGRLVRQLFLFCRSGFVGARGAAFWAAVGRRRSRARAYRPQLATRRPIQR